MVQKSTRRGLGVLNEERAIIEPYFGVTPTNNFAFESKLV